MKVLLCTGVDRRITLAVRVLIVATVVLAPVVVLTLSQVALITYTLDVVQPYGVCTGTHYVLVMCTTTVSARTICRTMLYVQCCIHDCVKDLFIVHVNKINILNE